MTANVVEVRQLCRSFGKTRALDNVDLDVQPGFVYGLVGANGAGKTTLIKHLLGLLRARQGTVRVFGLDPVTHPVQVLQRIGYLSEERDLPEWMRIEELLRYTTAYHPNWDHEYARDLLDRFQLDETKKVKELSKGMRAQAGLIAAVAHHPELLILDEPSTGLDPVVRKDILNAIIRAVADAGRAAIFSSHLLDEVEQMSDYVLMIDSGRIVVTGELDEIKSGHQRMVARFPGDSDGLPVLEGVISAEQQGGNWTLVFDTSLKQASQSVQLAGGEVLQARTPTLQEIFVARVGRDRPETVEEAAA